MSYTTDRTSTTTLIADMTTELSNLNQLAQTDPNYGQNQIDFQQIQNEWNNIVQMIMNYMAKYYG